jgi:hypothetical protein
VTVGSAGPGLDACAGEDAGLGTRPGAGAPTRIQTEPRNPSWLGRSTAAFPKRIVIGFDIWSMPGPEREGGHLDERAPPAPIALLWGERVGNRNMPCPRLGNQSGQSIETLIRLAASSQISLELPGFTGQRRGNECIAGKRRWTLALLIVLALIVALFIGLGFVVKWLFIIAAIAALIWLIAFFTGRARA